MTTSFTPSAGSEDSELAAVPFQLLRDALIGTLVTADDDGWDRARSPWLLGVDQRPAAVVLAASAVDVAETVRFAADHGLAVAAQSSGHGATGMLEGAILVRTGALSTIVVDVTGRTARVGAGVTWGALLTALDGTGLMSVPGSNPNVSVVGYCLGGGLSSFSRAFGTGARSLRAAEVVGADGELRWVTPDDDPELLWALRGGGGDFAIVTEVEIDLFDAAEIYGGRLVFPGSVAAQVFAAFAELTRSAPDELTTWASVMHFPDVPFVPAEVRGQSFAIVDVMFVGPAHSAEALLEPVRAAGPVIRETVRVLRPSEVGAVSEEPPEPTPAVTLGRALTDLDSATIERLLAVAGPGSGTPLTMVQVRHLGGALSAATAIAGAAVRLEAPYLLMSLGVMGDPDLETPIRAGLGAVLDAVLPVLAPELLLTFLAAEGAITDAYGASTLARLRAVKRAVDPQGVFRSNFPVLAD